MKHKLSQFSIACSVVATIVAPLAFLFYLSDEIPGDAHILLLTVWCILPFVWGVWAILIPSNWLPNRLPHWGALLGIILGAILILGFNFPYLIFELELSILIRILAILVIGAVYFLLWMIVKILYNRILM